jgi:RNA polymerase sigma factor (sigma-70 family)
VPGLTSNVLGEGDATRGDERLSGGIAHLQESCLSDSHAPATARLLQALDRIRPRLKQVLWHFRLRPEEAEDVLQEVVILALDHLKRTEIADLDGWLVVTLRNRCVMFYRSEAARHRREAVWAERLAARWTSGDIDFLTTVRRYLSTLPGRDRQILQLRLAGCSYLEVVAQTGYSIHVVREVNLSVLRRLRSLLGLAARPPRSAPS